MLLVFNEKRVRTDTGQDTTGSDSNALFYPDSSAPEVRYTSMWVFSSQQAPGVRATVGLFTRHS